MNTLEAESRVGVRAEFGAFEDRAGLGPTWFEEVAPVELLGLTDEEVARRSATMEARRRLAGSRRADDSVRLGSPAGHDGAIAVAIRLSREPEWTPAGESSAVAVVRGSSELERRTAVATLGAEWTDELLAINGDVIAAIEATGARSIDARTLAPTIVARVMPETMAAHRALPGVDWVEEIEVPSGESQVTNQVTTEASQSDQFVDWGYVGDEPNTTRHSFGRVTIGFPGGYFDDDHPTMLDDASSSRVLGRWDCTSGVCSAINDIVYDSSGQHGTRVVSIAAGDLTDAQDPDVTDATQRYNWSGVALESGILLGVSSGSTGWAASVRRFGLAAADIVSATTWFSQDRKCDGSGEATPEALNDAFRLYGSLPISAAGNFRTDDPTGCTVVDPGTAETAFTVGALGQCIADWNCATGSRCVNLVCVAGAPNTEADDGSVAALQSASFTPSSGRGGAAYLNGTRTILDMAAPGSRRATADPEASPPYSSIGCATSWATPHVVGAAAVLKHKWLDSGVLPGLVNQPGSLFATLLLMADRTSEAGTQKTIGFDPTYGAGRIRMRLLDEYGMDAPWGWSTGSVYVTDAASVEVPINGSVALPATVDQLRVVAWWPEKNIANQGANGADIVLRLVRCDGTSVAVDESYDTKKRVVVATGAGGVCYKLRLTGIDVPASSWELNNPRRTVYWAVMWEDTARDESPFPDGGIQ